MTLAKVVRMALMMRTLRAVMASMLLSMVALLHAPAMRGKALLASSTRASQPGMTDSTKPVLRSGSASSRDT